MSNLTRNVMLATVCVASIGACFPDEKLKARDAATDVRVDARTDAPVMDAPIVDMPVVDAVSDIAVDIAPDVTPADVISVPDAPDGGRCARVPLDPVAAMMVYDLLPDATYFAFDGAGQLAVASLRDVISIGAMGRRSLLFSALAGNVTALRYLRSGDLALAMLPTAMDGTLGGGRPGEGALYTAPANGMGTPALRVAVGRPGGIAVDGEGAVWFSDTPQNRVFRMTLRGDDAGPQVDPMVLDVMAPTWLAFDQTGRVLYITSARMGGSLYRVTLTRTVMGDLMPGDAQILMRDLGGISGLALDTCDNVYVADETGGRIVRAASPWDMARVLVRDVPNVRSLAFGQGGTFDGDTLFFLSMGAVRAASVGATGVALPVP